MDQKFQMFLDECGIKVTKRGTMPNTRMPGDVSQPDNILFRTGEETEVKTTNCTITFGPYSCQGYHMMMPDTYYVSAHGRPFDFLVAYGLCHALKCKKNITNGKIIAYTNIDEKDGSKYISFDVVNGKRLNDFIMSLRLNDPKAVMMYEKEFTKIAKEFIDSNITAST